MIVPRAYLSLLLLATVLHGAAVTLEPGASLERVLAAGETHLYGLPLKSGDYARIVVDQRGADVAVSVASPAGSPLARIDGPAGRFGPETVSILAETEGIYSLEVRPLEEPRPGGGYRLEVREIRPAGPDDARRVEAERLMNRGYELYGQGKPDDLAAALDLYRKALAAAGGLGETALEAELRLRLGQTLARQGDPRTALAELRQALALQRGLEDGGGAVRTLNLMGRAYRSAGDFPRALEAFREALADCERSGQPEQAAAIHNNIGLLLHQQGRPREALASYGQALSLYRQAEDRRNEAVALNNLGGVHAGLGQPAEARERYEQALALARLLGRRDLEANVLNNLGDLYSAAAQPRKAVEAFSAALSLFRETGDRPRQAAALNNLGTLLNDLGAAEEGSELLEQALSLPGEPRSKARTCSNLARAARDLGRPEESRQWLDRALTLYREAGDRPGEGRALFMLAVLHLDRADPRSAEGPLREALKLFQEHEDRAGQAMALRSLGRVRVALGDPGEAGRSFAEALRIGEALGDGLDQGRTLHYRARAERDRGDLDAARRSLEAALGHFESLRAEVGGERLRTTFFASVREAYDVYLDVLMRLHEARPGEGFDALALAAAERSRSRALLDVLARSEVEVRAGDPAAVAEHARLRQELAARAARRMDLLHEEKVEEAAEVEKEIEALSAEYRLAEERLRAGDPRYAALREPASSLAEIQGLLDGETVLLEYALGEERSWLWAVTPSSLSSFELPGRARIEELARRVHEHLRTPGAAGEERADLEALSRALLPPAVQALADRRLAIVADGALAYTPFAALPVPVEEGGTVPLAIRHEIVHLPSAAVLREIRRAASGRGRPGGDLAILADPVYGGADPRLAGLAKKPSPGARLAAAARAPEGFLRSLRGEERAESLERLVWSRREAEGIAAAAAGKDVLLALDFRASRDLALSPELARYRALHFATHGFLDPEHPELSGLALSRWDDRGGSRDGFLRLQDVYGLSLRAELVVLSGCETALGKSFRGEGLLGLAHGFLHAGASQVVASLWEVRDRATAELMERFYRAVYRDGLRPAAALRRAQAEMWEQRAWRDPFYWAAFTAQGDWRAFAP